jgi:hypothetical protein
MQVVSKIIHYLLLAILEITRPILEMSANAAQGLMNLMNPRNNRKNAANELVRLGSPVGRNALIAPAPIIVQPTSSNGTRNKAWNSQNQRWFTPVTVTAKPSSRKGRKVSRRANRKGRKTRSRR